MAALVAPVVVTAAVAPVEMVTAVAAPVEVVTAAAGVSSRWLTIIPVAASLDD
jgi:hypothetical protein